MMLQPYEIHESENPCDTTSVMTTPFSVKDILNMNINNEDYCNNSIKLTKDSYGMHSQFWDNSVFTSNEYNYYCGNNSDNRHYWNSDNVYGESYFPQHNPNIQMNEVPIRQSIKEEPYSETDNSSKSIFVCDKNIK